MTKKNILFSTLTAIAALIATSLSAFSAPGSWRLHASFDDDPERVFATPFGAYFFGLAQSYRPNHADNAERQGFLYRYDKKADEFEFLNSQGPLTDNLISTVEYNPRGGYLVTVYTNFNIDLIYDDGSVLNIPGLKDANISSSRMVNDITFDYDRDRVYLATDFGYVILNADRGEVDRSFIVNQPVTSVTRIGDEVVMLKDGVLYTAPATRPQFTMDDFTQVMEVPDALELLPVSSSKSVLKSEPAGQGYVYQFINPGSWTLTDITSSNRPTVDYAPEGIIIGSGAQFIYIKDNGVADTVTRMEEDFSTLGTTRDMREFWYARGREGLYSKKYDPQSSSKWSLTRGAMMPESSAVYRSTAMVYHPDYGMLVSNHGIDQLFQSFNMKTPVLLSALDRGSWKRLGLPYTNPSQASVLYNPNGLVVDPDNPDQIYFGSIFNGILRLNLADTSDVLHMASPFDPSRNLPGYVKMGDGNPWWTDHFKFSAPRFDNAGNLWSGYYNSQLSESEKKPRIEIWFWLSDDRKASVNAASFRPWKKWVVEGVSPAQGDIVYPLRHRDNQNIVLYASNTYGGPVMIFDHKGTLDTEADDDRVRITHPVNQDGTSIELERIGCFFEDPETGLVWVGATNGLFTFDPKKIFTNPNSVNNVKVSRDDGTDLADYLFNGSYVTDIIADPQGRKWFALNGGGIVCTSSDGRKLLLELTSENSPLPSDVVYSLCWNPSSNSLMVSTSAGLAEYFPSGESSSSDGLSSVRAYPNPVRPDYFGYVTIDGLLDNSLVKIMDTHGNLVKEFDLASGGEVKWDVTNLSHKRVQTGVYYILCSSGPSGESFSNVGKILVVN